MYHSTPNNYYNVDKTPLGCHKHVLCMKKLAKVATEGKTSYVNHEKYVIKVARHIRLRMRRAT